MLGEEGVGCLLWLVPEGEASQRYASVITEVARRFGTPVFDPHVTLLSGLGGPPVQVLARTAELAAAASPGTLDLGPVGETDEFFRCLFLAVLPSPWLSTRHRAAVERFGRPLGDFAPHLSLAYGRPLPAAKARLVEELGDLSGAVAVRTLQVVSTAGPVASWRRLRTLPLGRS